MLSRICAVLALASCASVLSSAAMADDQALLDNLVVNGQKMPVQSVASTPLPGINEVHLASGETFYTDDKGRYLLVGDLYENTEGGLVNLSEQQRNEKRKAQMDQVSEQDMVIFRPAGKVRHVLTVFTDTTCPYCHKLHDDVPALNKAGIEVRYLAFPRAGMGSRGAEELAGVWCSKNRSEAMTAAMKGDAKRGRTRCDSTVAAQYQLGQQIGIQGTPAIVLPDGQMIAGYLPAQRLIQMLEKR
ncbi:DsbC family protein [Larsenimonas rhizosphaerae]|uniref:Thiol:disulfide interchange protein n=1 Tax=Larsenimonas rhizosphaerae TaxID=2944682 RepID=A0AA41ZJE3_9GAMM|nr:DsbC family protein [Larsenimonas rhizosphaerae]MCM2131641.1 DsbC family protein [Larsenimonas rhizosphaerae]MCX2525033.1 DsbC family protein [Larsenimonas rhizosphaerae]